MEVLFETSWEIAVSLQLLSLVKKHPVIQMLKRNVMTTLLHYASKKGYVNVVNMFLHIGTQTETRNKIGCTPLFMAVAFGHSDVVRALVSAGADVNTQNKDGVSALIVASVKGDTDIVNILTNNGAYIETRENDGGRTPLWFAAAYEQTDVVRSLVSAGADVNVQRNDGVSALGIATQEGYVEVVSLLLDNGARTETRCSNDCTPLWIASAIGQTDVLRALVSAGANVNTQRIDGISALGFASQEGHAEVVNILLDNGAHIETKDNDGHTPLWLAANNGHTDVLRALVSAGADLNSQSNDSICLLSFATQEGYTEVVTFLLNNGADIEIKDNNGRTPLWFAAAKGQKDVVHALVSAGADVNTQTIDGVSALGVASQEGHAEVVNILLNNSAEIEIRDTDGRTPLWFAVTNGQTEIVRAFISAGADVNTQRNDCISSLCYAAQEGYIDVVSMFLDNGAQIETKDNDGRTPLWFASAEGQTDVVRRLVSAGADVNAQSIDGVPALGIASQEGHAEIVHILLGNGSQIEIRDNDGCTPLLFAARSGQTEVVCALVSAGADVNTRCNDGVSSLSYASMNGYVDVVIMLLDNGALIETGDNYGCKPLWYAAASGQTAVVRALVSAGADVNTQGNDSISALCFAIEEGHTEVVNILLDNGALIEVRDNDGCTPLWCAAASGQSDIVRSLVSLGADVNKQSYDGSSALSIASEKGHAAVVNILLHNGARIETRDNDGCTSLWFAASHGQTDVVRALMSAGADVNTQRNNGTSALGFASENGHVEIVNILLDNGAQIETRDNLGCTPLWFAAANGQTDVVRRLVSAGADVNTQGNDSVSALGFASQEGHIDTVKILLDNGSQTETRDNHGRTPLWCAAATGQVDVIDLLIGRGADVDCVTYDGDTPLFAAAVKGQKDAVMTLIRYGSNFSHLKDEYKDPLSVTVMWCQNDVEEILHLLINNGLCVTAAKRGVNLSALMLAALRGRLDAVSTLVNHGADIHERNYDNMYPIDVASYCGHTGVVQFLTSCNSSNSSTTAMCRSNLYPPSAVHIDCRCNTAVHLTTDIQTMISLLEHGADVEAENVDGLRPIHCAVRTGLVELVELLIQHGANVDAADVFGNRPLHEAVCHGLNVVQLLVQRGAKLNVQNIDGKTPLHIAVERQQSDVIVFLLSQDADVGVTDVWRNSPLHYFTSELFTVRGVVESVLTVLNKKSQHLCIRNTMDVSVFAHLKTYGISENSDSLCQDIAEVAGSDKERMTQINSVNHLGCEKIDADCYGNTPLHYAVGVYGQLKMFKVSTDVTKIVEYLVKHGADINAQNKDGLTPLHVARGQEAIEACLRHADDQSFTITDKRGRNFWHNLFLTRTQNEVELATSIRPVIAKPDAAKYDVDDLNRTPLHYACMNVNPWIAEWNWMAKEFVENFSDEHINKQDIFGRTALHYAAIGGNSELADMLKTKKADDTIKDNYQRTSNEYAEIRRNFQTKKHLGLTKSSSLIADRRRDISACIQGWFADSSSTVGLKECKSKMQEILMDLTADRHKILYVLLTYHLCRHDYSDVSCGNEAERLYKQEDFAANNDKSDTEPTTMFEAIQSRVHNAMEELAKAISDHDHRFACEVYPVGSAHEGTKIGCCDEFDYNFVLTNLSSICEVSYSPESPPGFIQLKASAPVYDEELKSLFDQNGIINTRIIKLKFETLAKQILSSASFCELTDFEFTDPASIDYLGVTPGNVSAKLHTQIKLTFTKPVNNHHVPHAVSIDLVPVLHINDWWPEDARRKELCREGECLIVFTQPQSKYPWIGWTEPHGFISFARAESRLLRECHPVAKAAYMVPKHMSQYYCQFKFCSSYVIKMALLWCLDEKEFTKYRSSDGSDEVEGGELLCLVQNILRRLLCFAAQDYVPAFFMPKYHQPVWLSERYLKQYHMRLYQHGLTYKDLFSLSVEQSHDEVLLSIKSMFTFSHVMYWSLLSDADAGDLKLFVPSSINPLREISYDDSDE